MTGSVVSPMQEMQLKAQQKGMEEQAKAQATAYNDELGTAATTAQDATQMSNLVDQFKDAYGKSKYVGTIEGNVPSTGWSSAPFAITHNMKNEQLADNAAQNMQMMLLKLMKTNRLTNYELQFTGNLKLNRKLDAGTVDQLGDFFKAKSERLGEYQNFLNAAQNQNIPPQQAKAIWSMYENQRPVYDFTKGNTNKEYLGSWKDYLNPDAVNSVTTGSPYVPQPKSEKDLRYLNTQEKIALYNRMKAKK